MGFFDRVLNKMEENANSAKALREKYSVYSDSELISFVRREGNRNMWSKDAHAAFFVLQDRGYSTDEILHG